LPQSLTRGRKAGNNHRKYSQIKINGRLHQAHRVIFLWHHGYLPQTVDHINRIKSDNRIENLRPATHSQQAQNQAPRKDGSCKWRGVTLQAEHGKYQAILCANSIRYYLGWFENPDDAATAYNEAATELHGEFAVLNESPLNHIPLEEWA
jgi:hypothetical protein